MLIIRYFGSKGVRKGWDIISVVINILFGEITLFGGILLIICGILFISMSLLGPFMLVEKASIYVCVSFVIAGLTGLAATLTRSGEQIDIEQRLSMAGLSSISKRFMIKSILSLNPSNRS